MIKQDHPQGASADVQARLEDTERELDAVLTAVSHNMRAPLRAIAGFADVLREDLSGKIDESSENHLKRLCSRARALDGMLEGIVTLSRINRMPCVVTHEDVSFTCTDILRGLQDAHPRRIVSTRVTPSMEINTDRRLLRMALEALLGNAWKFTGHAPAARIDVDIRRSQTGGLVIRIEDNGCGFDAPAAGDRLYGPFQRFHSGDEHAGLGVGLAIAKRVVTKLHGTLSCDAAAGRGAIFTLTLPSTPCH